MMTPKTHDEKSLDPFRDQPPDGSSDRRWPRRRAAVAATSIRPGRTPVRVAAPRCSQVPRPRPYRMKKSINLWAFPYPQRMTLRECLQLAKDAGSTASSSTTTWTTTSRPSRPPSSTAPSARWPRRSASPSAGSARSCTGRIRSPTTTPQRRKRGLELARLMIEAAHELGTENLLTIAGSTYIPWIPDREPVPIDVCDRRARESIGQLVPSPRSRVCTSISRTSASTAISRRPAR